IPRGGALGMVMSLPEMDRHSWHKDQMKDRIAMGMAGKAAEIKKWGEERVSSGASGDIQNVSAVARAMVMRWGMSDKIGNIDYSEAHEGYQGNAGGFSVSAETKRVIEDEVKSIIDEGYDRAMQILNDNEEAFERLAKGLLEYETLTGDEIRKVIEGLPLGDDNSDQKPSSGGTPSVAALPKTRARKPKSDPGAEPAPT
ncbi:MAG TPA: cell division protein FtsH, partial [Tabrizicola sp.]|nr:cell division protein FtsH [Tabrizicola sp.]